MKSRGASSRAPDRHLPPALQLHILSFLPSNARALSGRLVSPDAAASLSNDPTCTASLSQPLPPHALPWAVEAGQQHVRQLPFRHKLQLLCIAAASGCKVNLEVALALLQPSVFPEVLQQTRKELAYPNPGVAAVKAGHPQLLGWLLRHCPALLAEHCDILMAAAQHCDLTGLQAACKVVRCRDSTAAPPPMNQGLLDWVAESPVDGEAKVEWVLAEGGGSCSLQASTAAAAARSGDLGRLRWLRERGCPMGRKTLESALQHADLAVAEWLVDEAGCKLPAAAGVKGQWERLLDAAAKSSGGVAKLQWLRERGAPPLPVEQLLRSAAGAGRVEVVQHLLPLREALGAWERLMADQHLCSCAVASGSVPTMEFLHQAGYTDRALWFQAYHVAALAVADTVAVFVWLGREAGLYAGDFNLVKLLQDWPNDTPAHSWNLLQMVRLLVGEAGYMVWGSEVARQIAAAKRGDLALVQYLLQQTPGCRPGWRVLLAAAEGGCEALLEWLVERHPSCVESAGAAESPYVLAAVNGDLGTLTALRRLGVPWGAGNVVVQAGREGAGVSALQWLVDQGGRTGGT